MKGQAVIHPSFGRGTVQSLRDNILTVRFTESEKRFVYPDAFRTYLSFADEDAQRRAEGAFLAARRQQEAAREAAQLERQRQQRIQNFSVQRQSQAAFDVTKQADALTLWRVHAGVCRSGASRGAPRVPARLMPNSACLLTLRPPGGPESERTIAGVFMVPRDFFGDGCTDGWVPAHPEYRLAPEERLPFWAFFPEAAAPRWGGGSFRYFSNTTMMQILEAFCTARAASDRLQAAAFLRYFAKINAL